MSVMPHDSIESKCLLLELAAPVRWAKRPDASWCFIFCLLDYLSWICCGRLTARNCSRVCKSRLRGHTVWNESKFLVVVAPGGLVKSFEKTVSLSCVIDWSAVSFSLRKPPYFKTWNFILPLRSRETILVLILLNPSVVAGAVTR